MVMENIMSDETKKPTEMEFRAEVQKILSLVINSLYTNTEVFLRELISNASDALDKARFLQLTDDSALEQEGEAGIDIFLDAENKTLTISDNGVGMTRSEVIENLGTIARSGTSEFVKQFGELTKKGEQDKALELIGQFGVGFYAVFMVADRVDVHTKSMNSDEEAVIWRSEGTGTYTVVAGERDKPGTSICVHLKEDALEFAQPWRVKGIVEKYSDFVMFPIKVDDEVANQSAALWRQPRSAVTEEQHTEFFKHITQSRLGDSPLTYVHYQVDAPVQFSSLLYVPQKAPVDVFQLQKKRPGLRLYAKRVLIMENCDTLLPVYLRFVRGVVDSEDLQLNVSRETLQENRTVKQIEQQLTRQVLKGLSKLAENDTEKYDAFWKELGPVLKEGVSMDFKNKDAIVDLCRFYSLNSNNDLLSLESYIENIEEDQKEIYYLTGTDREQMLRSPHLEAFRDKGLDVLLLTDPIDEWVVNSLSEFKDCKLRSVTHGEIDLNAVPKEGDDANEADSKDEDTPDASVTDEIQAALQAVKEALGDKVADVRASRRLTSTAACLVSKEGDPGANFERIMRMLDEQTQAKKRILEINPKHEVVSNLSKLVALDPASPQVGLWSQMLYQQALLSEGVVEDPAQLVENIQRLLLAASAQELNKAEK